VWGGGHVSYRGNEVYALNLSSTPSVARLTNPSVFHGDCSPNDDGTPLSKHTYGGLVYLPRSDRMFTVGGVNYCDTTDDVQNIWTFDFASLTWTLQIPGSGSGPTNGYRTVLDPTTDDETVILYWGNDHYLTRYDATKNTHTALTAWGTPHLGEAVNCAIDPQLKLFMCIGESGENSGVFQATYMDISAGTTYAVTDLSSTLVGCSGMNENYPGFVYDPAINKFVGYPNYGNTAYIID